MEIQHIYWFAPYNLTCPSTRYRGKLPLDHLSENYGITYDFIYPDKSWEKRLKFCWILVTVLLFRKTNSLIVIQKIITNRWYANLLKLLVRFQSKYTLYDIDDAEYYRAPAETLHYFLEHCSMVSVSSEALKKYVSTYNQKILELTSPVPQHIFKKKMKEKPFTIGWVGDFGNGHLVSKDFSHKTNLYQILFPQLKRLDFPFRLTLIGVKKDSDVEEIQEYFKDCRNIELNIPLNLNWEKDDWLYPMIAQFDIGLSPMLDHPFNQAKSAFKAKQYLSCGIPVIASDVGENRNFVKHDFNGLLCQSFDDFQTAIEQFYVMNEKEYFRFSRNGFKSRSVFSVENYCQQLVYAFQNQTRAMTYLR